MPKFLAGFAIALTLSFAPVAPAHALQHSITVVTEDEKHEGPENPEHQGRDSDEVQFVILGVVIVLGITGVIVYRRFKR